MRKRRNGSKKAVLFLSMLAMMLLVAACGGAKNNDNTATNETATTTAQSTNGASGESEKKPVTLKFLFIWPEHSELMEKTIQMFKDQNKDTIQDVEITTSTWDKVQEVIQTSIAANEQHDVAFNWTTNMTGFVESGGALDLTPYLEADPEWKNSFIGENMLDLGKIDGKFYNIPFRGTGFYIGYNKTMFDANGWKEPQTLEELEKMMDEMMAKGITPFAANQGAGAINYFKIHENILAGSYDDPNFKLGRKAGIIEPYAKAIQRSKDWSDKGYFGKNSYTLTREETQSMFYNDKGAMYLFNNNEIGDIQKALGNKEFGLFPFPSPEKVKEKIVFGGFDGFFASASTKHPDEAVALLKFLTSKEVQEMWAKEAASSMVIKGIQYDNPLVKKASDLFQYVGKFDITPNYSQGDMAIRNSQAYEEFMIRGNSTAEELAKKWDENLKTALKDAGIE